MRVANLSPATKVDGKDPLERMLLDTVDAALVGALIAVQPITISILSDCCFVCRQFEMNKLDIVCVLYVLFNCCFSCCSRYLCKQNFNLLRIMYVYICRDLKLQEWMMLCKETQLLLSFLLSQALLQLFKTWLTLEFE